MWDLIVSVPDHCLSFYFPTIWKQAKVNPLFKTGAKDELNNYRSISISPTLSKIIEKWISMKLM